MTTRASAAIAGAICLAASLHLQAHDGPPYPVVSDRTVGPYVVSLWTDPDTTDDGSAGGQFWVRLAPSAARAPLPEETRAVVSVQPMHHPGAEQRAPASPVNGDVTNQFAAVEMDHEGHFAVRVTVEGPLGTATLESTVEATYDQRPPRFMLIVYLAPFVAIAFLWGRLLARRRALPLDR